MRIDERIFKLVIPPQIGISVEIMKRILNLEGYLVEIDESGKNCEIKYHALRFAQKAEHDLKQRFECKVYIDDKCLVIKCDTFKEHGKWNSEENVFIPKNTPDWNIRIEVEKARSSKDLTYYGTYPNNVPFIVFPRKDLNNHCDNRLVHRDELKDLLERLDNIEEKVILRDC